MIRAASPSPDSFSLSAARQIVHDCFRVKPWVYWTDFSLTYGLGLYCYGQVRGASLLSPHQGFVGGPRQVFCFIASVLLFYRATLFIHELVHQRQESLRLFRFVWNLICGIPFLIPTFVYYTHIDHHRRAHYGTDHDGEYLPLAHHRPWYILFYLSWTLLIPAVAVIRFMVLTPIAWSSPAARRWIHQHLSSMVMDPTYIRPLPTAQTVRVMRWQELGCFLWCWGIALVPPVFLDRWPIPFVAQAYLTAIGVLLLNSVRTLGSHRWTNAGGEMTFVDQLLDSVNVPSTPWLTELWGPVGTRYHALHHLFPSMPYHEMPRAHRQLMAALPPDSPYRRTMAPSLMRAIADLWVAAADNMRAPSPALETGAAAPAGAPSPTTPAVFGHGPSAVRPKSATASQ